MLIRVRGYNSGIKEYLEEGNKAGRELTRDELDHRMIIDGDLDLTDLVYQSIPDKGQERYMTVTLSFAEDEIPKQTLHDITSEFKAFMMSAYHEDEYNFYAEAHIPTTLQQINRKTGELEDRKPHIHIVIPRKNLLTGKDLNPRGDYEQNVDFFEAFQEHINQKYQLVSPRERIRVDPQDAASVLSRYKGDDFRGKNREFKTGLVRQVIEQDVKTRADFYQLVGRHGETRIRNEGKPTEYIAVKLPGDQKFTNLKESIFGDDFVVRRELKKDPLPAHVIEQRLNAWPERAREIKYISKAGPSVRQRYYATPAEQRPALLAERIERFYRGYGAEYEHLHIGERARDLQRGAAEAGRPGPGRSTDGLQGLSRRDVDVGRQGRQRDAQVLLPTDARLHLATDEGTGGGNPGLRPVVPAGRERGTPAASVGAGEQRPAGAAAADARAGRGRPARQLGSPGRAGSHPRVDPQKLPPYARNPNRPAFVDDVERHTERVLRSLRSPPPAAVIHVRVISAEPGASARESSTPTAYAVREHEQNRLKPAERRALRQINQRFYETRRLVRTDPRFTRQERAQLVAVLVFERMKAKQAITDPQQQESISMKSAEIRALVDPQKRRLPENSIAGPELEQTPPARARLRLLVTRLGAALDEYKAGSRSHVGSAQDMYTKRARFSQNVHYLDKGTDKTVFVDTGKAIALRKHGMSEGGVSVALDLARERFGSTLTIKGSDEFKRTIVDVAAKRGLDLHFTDPQMNQRLAERKAELAIEQEGLKIEAATVNTAAPAAAEQAKASERETVAESAAPALPSVIRGQLLEHGAAPYQNDPSKDASYYVKLQTDLGERTMWGKDFRQLMEQGQFQPGERIRLQDHGTQAVDVVHQHADGTADTKVAHRRIWTVDREGMDLNREPVAPQKPAVERSEAPARDTRLDGSRILQAAAILREAGFDREANVFADAVFEKDRWPDALASLRALAKNPAEACPDASQGAKEVAFRLYENVERDLFKQGIDYRTVADAGQVTAPPTSSRDEDISF
ncbi:Large polyvalent protein-associated domain 7 [compost metagenome]